MLPSSLRDSVQFDFELLVEVTLIFLHDKHAIKIVPVMQLRFSILQSIYPAQFPKWML